MPSTWFSIQALAGLLLQTTNALELPDYRALKTYQNASVLEITLHNPKSPLNLWSQDIQSGLTDIVQRLQVDNETKVVIFKSDVPRFFSAHLDLLMPGVDTIANSFATLMFNISDLPQVTIAAVEGRARGAGNELMMASDMRFATKSETLFGQIEVANGLLPGGGGSQHLPRLIGRGRAMEYILSGKDITAEEAEKIGWINKAFDTSEDMYAYIDELTSRLRLFPLAAMTAAKQSINLRARPSYDDYLHDVASFNQRLADPVTQQLLGRAAAVTKNFSLGDAELNLGRDLILLYE